MSHWLALREPADIRARSAALTRAVVYLLARHIDQGPLRLLDLATGTGSNVRYLADRLPAPQHWLLVDQDLALIGEVADRMSAWGAARGCEMTPEPKGIVLHREQLECHIRIRRLQLGTLEEPGIFPDRHLVTASALLDLVSERWLRALATQCRVTGSTVLFTLNYNGQSRCEPVEPEDEMVRDLMNWHQKTSDKGFGRAAGPDAVECAERSFGENGYRVRREASDWELAPQARALQRELIEGWASAATEIAPEHAPLIRSWLARRLAHVEAVHSRITVGHEDILAWLPGRVDTANLRAHERRQRKTRQSGDDERSLNLHGTGSLENTE